MSLNCSSHSEEYQDVTDEMDLLDLREHQDHLVLLDNRDLRDQQVLEEELDQEVSTNRIRVELRGELRGWTEGELRGWTERRVERLD